MQMGSLFIIGCESPCCCDVRSVYVLTGNAKLNVCPGACFRVGGRRCFPCEVRVQWVAAEMQFALEPSLLSLFFFLFFFFFL